MELSYKGYPLMRKDNMLYYGSMADKYIVMLQILTTKKIFDETISDRVLVQLLLTDEKASPKDRCIKVSEKRGLYDALDIANIWLARALKD